MILEYQDDPEVRNLDLEYLLGEFILVVPIFDEEGFVSYYLPKESWIDLWSRKKVEGGQWIKEKLPLNKMPIFLRENSLIPTIDPPEYIDEKKIMEIKLKVWLKDKANIDYCFNGEEFIIEACRNGKETILKLGPSKKSWSILLHDMDKPLEVRVANGKLENWKYSEKEKICLIKLKHLERKTTVRVC